MNRQMAEEIKQDFLDWSGGFRPESERQIWVYVETSKDVNVDDEELINLLRDWMNAEEGIA